MLLYSLWQRRWGYLPATLILAGCLINWAGHCDPATLAARAITHLIIFFIITWLLLRAFRNGPISHDRQSWIQLSAIPVLFLPGSENSYPVYILIFFTLYLLILIATGPRVFFTSAPGTPLWMKVAGGVTSVLFIALLVQVAWIGDDAFITFRTVDNFLHGYGLRWNILERVQSYTHPLWMLLLSAATVLTQDVYYSAILVSFICTLLAIRLVIREGIFSLQGIMLLLIMLSSKAFMDYTSSGLENPLSYLLTGIFLYIWYDTERPRRFFLLVLISALAATNRHDLVLLYVPCLLAEFFRTPFRVSRIGWAAVGLLPLIAWTAFSLIYYGFPFPNTAYAKLSTGIPDHEFFVQGLLYYMDSVGQDPVTLILIAGILVLAAASRKRPHLLPAAGILLYLVYVVKIGGDFMSGRFFSVPFYAAVFLLSRMNIPLTHRYSAMAFCILISAFSGHAPLRLLDGKPPPLLVTSTGIADERGYYTPYNSLTRFGRTNSRVPPFEWIRDGLDNRQNPYADTVQVIGTIGMKGYYSGPRFYFIDFLSDPILSRLPMSKGRPWRPGHYYRPLPPGYLTSRRTGTNAIHDPGLAMYFEKMKMLTEGPLWSAERFAEIWRFNAGYYDHLLPDAGEVASWPENPNL